MNFLSLEFSIVFMGFLVGYWLLAQQPKMQNIGLLLASYLLVASYSVYAVVVLLGYSLCIYALAKVSYTWQQSSPPAVYQNYSIIPFFIFLIGLTFFIFKYYDIWRDTLQSFLQWLGLPTHLLAAEILLPIGLSFYAFHSISYIVAIHRKELQPVPLQDLLLYLAFFPSVISGPINRAVDSPHQQGLLSQLRTQEPRNILYPKKIFWLVLLAIIKLWILSSYLGDLYVDPIFDSPEGSSGVDTLVAIYAYSFQIYCNFSGYSDLVLALGYLLGIQLPINFQFPYLARSVKEFWDRWHISLSRCIRDFIYIPLGGSQKGWIRTQIHVAIAMVLSGMWHGVGLTFILWGAFHAVGLIVYNGYQRIQTTYPSLSTQRLSEGSRHLIARLFTFHFIGFTWIFFRASSMENAGTVLESLWSGAWYGLWESSAFWGFWVLILFYPLWVHLLLKTETMLARLSWPWTGFVYLILIQGVISIAPSGVPGFIYASF